MLAFDAKLHCEIRSPVLTEGKPVMRSPHCRRLANVVLLIVATLGLVVAGVNAPAAAAPAASLPALPAPLNIPGAQNAIEQAVKPGEQSSLLGGGTAGGGAAMDGKGRTNIALPLVPQGGVRKQFTAAPRVEQSTRPACAPFMMIAVPGTFEINRDDDPNKATGLLGKLADSLKQSMGDQFSFTMINYDADAGVNGTSYNRSTENGYKKALATTLDVGSRCADSKIILTGYSQGADIAGDLATAVGNKRTAIDPARIVAAPLFADPQRANNSNVIAGTNQSRPDIPSILQDAIGAVANDPSFAQMQMSIGNSVQSLLGQAGLSAGAQNTPSGQQEAGGRGTGSVPAAGGNTLPSAEAGQASGSAAPNSASATNDSSEQSSAVPQAGTASAARQGTDGGDSREMLVFGIYRLGGCTDGDQQQTWTQCLTKFTGGGNSGADKKLTDAQLKAMADQLESHATNLPWVASSLPSNPNDCLNKTAQQCATQSRAATNETVSDSSTTQESTGGSTDSREPSSQAAGAGASTSEQDAGAESTTTGSSGASDSSSSSTTSTQEDGGLASQLAGVISGGASGSTSAPAQSGSSQGDKVSVPPITQRAVSGGGLAGPRDTGFGDLTGRVISLCVPGDLFCSMPENSQLARDLTHFAQNVSVNFPDMLSSEGATRMGGLLALQGLNMVADITGIPRTKLSADTLQSLINIAAGGVMLATENPAGAALIANGVAQLPNALPELFQQIADIPEILRKIPTAPDTVMKNTGIDKVIARVNAAFQKVGMNSPLDVQKYPAAANALVEGLVKDNTGVVELVTNPQYWKTNAHIMYPELKVSGNIDSVSWVAGWFDQLARMLRGQ